MSKSIRLIGDVHGKWDAYAALIKDVPVSIQVGDMGVGFFNPETETYSMPPEDLMVKGSHKYIRGNHDNPNFFNLSPYSIKDGTTEEVFGGGSGNWMFCGGAYSVDHHLRTIGVDWWGDEELTIHRFIKIINNYEIVKPKVMVTHDCPQSLLSENFFDRKIEGSSRTRQALQAMLESHQPEFWFFGHWHKTICEKIGKTTFVCLAELDYVDFDGTDGLKFSPIY